MRRREAAFYLFKGRYKDLIIRGGQNISPEEIETLVGEHPKVAAIGCSDERLGEKSASVWCLSPAKRFAWKRLALL